ncbi:MAG: BACON domain-containing protein, partial [Prevotella sp.]|nr:BACON domain-containing protein [Prevotella sp.]
MKLKYIILSFIAALSIFTSCSDDNDPTYLDEVRLSSSYVALPQNGGSQTIDITAKDSWTIDASTVPEWLTI